MLLNTQDIALQSLRILYTFVLRGEKVTILQHFATKLCHSTNFNILFLAVVKDFVLPA